MRQSRANHPIGHLIGSHSSNQYQRDGDLTFVQFSSLLEVDLLLTRDSTDGPGAEVTRVTEVRPAADLNGVNALPLQHQAERHEIMERETIFEEVVAIDLDHHREMRPNGITDCTKHPERKTGPVLQRAAILVIAAIEVRRQEL